MTTDRKLTDSQPRLANALAEAQSIIAAAEQRATELVTEAEKGYQEALNSGFETGQKQGYEECVATAIRFIEDTGAVSEQLAEAAAQLAMTICATLIGEQLKVDPQSAKKIALAAIHGAVIGETARIIVNPEDQQIFVDAKGELLRLSGGGKISIETDEKISRGGCLVQTDFGEVDATIENLLTAMATRLGISTNGL